MNVDEEKYEKLIEKNRKKLDQFFKKQGECILGNNNNLCSLININPFWRPSFKPMKIQENITLITTEALCFPDDFNERPLGTKFEVYIATTQNNYQEGSIGYTWGIANWLLLPLMKFANLCAESTNMLDYIEENGCVSIEIPINIDIFELKKHSIDGNICVLVNVDSPYDKVIQLENREIKWICIRILTKDEFEQILLKGQKYRNSIKNIWLSNIL